MTHGELTVNTPFSSGFSLDNSAVVLDFLSEFSSGTRPGCLQWWRAVNKPFTASFLASCSCIPSSVLHQGSWHHPLWNILVLKSPSQGLLLGKSNGVRVIPFCPIIPILSIYPKEILLKKEGGSCIQKGYCSIFIWWENLKQSKCPTKIHLVTFIFHLSCTRYHAERGIPK